MWGSGGLCPEAEGRAPWGALAPSLPPCWATAKARARGASPAPAAPGVQAGTLHTALPALPDGVGNTLDADAVGELPRSLPLACAPDAAALLQGGRHWARHPRVPGLHSLPASLTLLAGCLALSPPLHRHCHHAFPGTAQGQLSLPRVRAGRCPRHLPPQRKQRGSLFFLFPENNWSVISWSRYLMYL